MATKILNKASDILLVILIFSLPLFFAPFLTDSFELGKQVLLLVFSFLLFSVWTAKSIISKKISWKKGPFLLPVFLLFLSFLFSTIINSPNKTNSFAAPVGSGAVLLLLIAYFLLHSLAKQKYVLFSILGSAVVTALISLVLVLGKFSFPLNFPSLNLALTQAWNPTGSLVSQAVFLLAAATAGFGLIFEEIKKKNLPFIAGLAVANVLILSGLGMSLHLLTGSAKTILLPQSTAWVIALESLKTGRTAFFGLGPGQFVNAFTSLKPLFFNQSEYWNLRFGSSSNWYFQLLTEVGLVGLFVYLFLDWKILKSGLRLLRQVKSSPTELAVFLALFLVGIIQFFVPLNFYLFSLFFLLLALIDIEKTESSEVDLGPLGKLSFLIFVIPFALWVGLLFFAGKLSLANFYFSNSLKAASQNDGAKAYNLQIKAIQTDPSSTTYRIAYSQINLALANSLAAKKDLTDNERSTISQLVQQSIREAKAAVTVNPGSVASWENLAAIYRSLINFAQGADQWAVAAYQQAINTEPANPRLRIDLGGLYYGQQRFDEAIQLFSQAASLKPDLANAHYNLANAFREKGDLLNAKREYETTQTLVKIDSDDYQKVTAELEEVKKRLAPTPTPIKKEALSPETLSTPPSPAPGIKPPLELPNEGPNISPSPSPEPAP